MISRKKLENTFSENEKKIRKIKKQLKHFPEGHLLCLKNQQYIKWYHSKPGGRIYIPKSKKSLAEKLSLKEYLLSSLADLENEQKAITNFLSTISNHHSRLDIFKKNQDLVSLLPNSYTPLSEELAAWAEEEYEKNDSHPEGLKFKSFSGKMVRSKSELIIEQALFIHKIPYRYEMALMIGDVILHPDFVIRHPVTGEFFIWEHFGMMDNTSYSQNTFQKLQMYNMAGYMLNVNLIATFESKEHPLDTAWVEKLIEHYFL